MSLQKGKRRKSSPESSSETTVAVAPRFPSWLFPFTLGAILVGSGVFLAMADSATETVAKTATRTSVRNTSAKLPTLGDLASMSDEQLSDLDIAVMNLRCAEGLPGAKHLDIQKCRRQLDRWAAKVKSETDRHLYRVNDPRFAEHYRKSVPYFKASMMLQVLQEDCGVHYNHARIRDIDFTKSQDLFLHGMIGNDNGGTCVSMPVLYTAIGRRLGYPIKLVLAKAHVFCRWDGPKDRFNIEGTGEGFSSFEDDYYMKWPKPISEAEAKAGFYLRSLLPREEMAIFLATRGHCQEDTGKFNECYVSYSLANQLAPRHPEYGGFLTAAVMKRQDARMLAYREAKQHLQHIQKLNAYNRSQIQQQAGYADTGSLIPHQTGYRGSHVWSPGQNQFSNPFGQQPAGYFPNQGPQTPVGIPGY